MIGGIKNRNTVTWIFILLILLCGAALRVNNIGDRMITHPEFYIPGLEIPEYVTHPNQRYTFSEVLSTPYKYHHPHLPGHDLLMLGWVSLFGTEIHVLRYTSLIMGTFAIFALFLFARESVNNGTALLSSTILAFHGYHVYWSQLAKQWELLAFLGLFSAYLLSRLVNRWSLKAVLGYAVVCSYGLWVDSYFWPVFAAQVLWILFRDAQYKKPSNVLQLQFIVILISSGALPYLIRFSGLDSHLPPELWPRILEMAQIGGIVIPESDIKLNWLVGVLIALMGMALFIFGIKNIPMKHEAIDGISIKGNSILTNAMFVMVLGLPFLSFYLFHNNSVIYHLKSFYFTSIFPFFVLGIWLLLRAKWGFLSLILLKVKSMGWLNATLSDLPTILALIPFGILVPIHLTKPVLTPYALISLSPFIILIISRGILSLKFLYLRIFIIFSAMGLCAFSLYQQVNIPNPRDYKILANVLKPQVQKGDVLLIDDKWYIVPIIYYFPPSQYIVRPSSALDLNDGNMRNTGSYNGYSRFWLIDIVEEKEQEMQLLERLHALSPYMIQVKQVRGGKGVAVLLKPKMPIPILPVQKSYPAKPGTW